MKNIVAGRKIANAYSEFFIDVGSEEKACQLAELDMETFLGWLEDYKSSQSAAIPIEELIRKNIFNFVRQSKQYIFERNQ